MPLINRGTLMTAMFLLGIMPALSNSRALAAEEKSAPAVSYVRFVSTSHQLSLDIPEGGELTTPDSPGWDKPDNVAFRWSGEAGQIVGVTANFLDFSDQLKQLNDEQFAGFLKASEDDLLENKDNHVIGHDSYESKTGRKWQVLHMSFTGDPDTTVYSDLYYSYEAAHIYKLGFYRYGKEDAQADSQCRRMADSFKPYAEDPSGAKAKPAGGN